MTIRPAQVEYDIEINGVTIVVPHRILPSRSLPAELPDAIRCRMDERTGCLLPNGYTHGMFVAARARRDGYAVDEVNLPRLVL